MTIAQLLVKKKKKSLPNFQNQPGWIILETNSFVLTLGLEFSFIISEIISW